jgi:hypothetical protein
LQWLRYCLGGLLLWSLLGLFKADDYYLQTQITSSLVPPSSLPLELPWVLSAFEILNPQQFYWAEYWAYSPYFTPWRQGLLFVLQLLLLLPLAEFARDAVRRRKWGHGEG